MSCLRFKLHEFDVCMRDHKQFSFYLDIELSIEILSGMICAHVKHYNSSISTYKRLEGTQANGVQQRSFD